jgi:hypothetical protein
VAATGTGGGLFIPPAICFFERANLRVLRSDFFLKAGFHGLLPLLKHFLHLLQPLVEISGVICPLFCRCDVRTQAKGRRHAQ